MSKYTEKQMEDWLLEEVRDLPMPDGTTRPVRGFKLLWEKFDSLVLLNGYSQLELVQFALDEVQIQQNVEFEYAFRNVIAYLDNRRRDAWGVD